LDFGLQVYEKQRKMVVAEASEREKWSVVIGLRRLIRESKLSQEPVSNAIKGKPVRRQTLSTIRQAANRITGASFREDDFSGIGSGFDGSVLGF
jgi:hypothetical protein